MVNCKWCNKQIKEKKDNFASFCDKKCNKRYNYYNNQEKYIKQTRDWVLKNYEHVRDYKKGLYENQHIPKRGKLNNEQKMIIKRLRNLGKIIIGREVYSKTEKYKQYKKEYRRRPEVKRLQRMRWKKWKEENREQVRIRSRLQNHIHKAINKFMKNGQLISSKKPINLSLTLVAKNLLINLPKDYNERKYHIDHITPVCSFDLTKEEEILKAYSIENTRWLPAEENLRKVGEDSKKSIWRNKK